MPGRVWEMLYGHPTHGAQPDVWENSVKQVSQGVRRKLTPTTRMTLRKDDDQYEHQSQSFQLQTQRQADCDPDTSLAHTVAYKSSSCAVCEMARCVGHESENSLSLSLCPTQTLLQAEKCWKHGMFNSMPCLTDVETETEGNGHRDESDATTEESSVSQLKERRRRESKTATRMPKPRNTLSTLKI